MKDRTVTLRRDGELVEVRRGKGDINRIHNPATFERFYPICSIVSLFLGRPLSELESVNIQAMLGSNSISKLTIGPGAKMHYERADRSCHQ